MKLKKGDNVIVIAGKDNGKKSTIVRVLPQKNMVVLDGLNISKRHRRRTSAAGKGQIIEKAMPIHASNVALVDPKSGKPTRVKIARTEKGGRERVAVKSGQKIK
jgi:large subunit ribosomal protein L24